jgi:hypothetical protein
MAGGDTIQVPMIDIQGILLWLFDVLRGGPGDIANHREEILSAWNSFYLSYATISITVCLFLIVGIAYCLFRIHQIRTREYQEIHASALWNRPVESADEGLPGEAKWKQVGMHASANSPSEWRLAILEADIILDELVFEKFGHLGDTLGDRLKKVARGDFETIDKAWEAHRIRNAIAHEGSDFQISERDMRHAINLYREVLEEFHYI